MLLLALCIYILGHTQFETIQITDGAYPGYFLPGYLAAY
jgi:hypothetical protein